MTLAFAVVFILLAKFGFPVIQKSVDRRREYIDSSLAAAGEAQKKLDDLQVQMDEVRRDAEKQKTEILRSAVQTREQLIAEARRKAGEEGEKIIAAAKASAQLESDAIIRDARRACCGSGSRPTLRARPPWQRDCWPRWTRRRRPRRTNLKKSRQRWIPD